MRGTPEAFPVGIRASPALALIAHTPLGLPGDDAPAMLEEIVMDLPIAAEHDAQQGIVALGETPGFDIMRDGARVYGIAVHVPALLCTVGWVQQDTRQAMVEGDGWPRDALPIATAYPHTA